MGRRDFAVPAALAIVTGVLSLAPTAVAGRGAIAPPQAVVDQLMDDAGKGANAVLTIDLDKQTISRPDGEVVHFEIDPFRKHCLFNGLDDIGLTEQKGSEIAAYEQKARLQRPWVFGMTQTGT